MSVRSYHSIYGTCRLLLLAFIVTNGAGAATAFGQPLVPGTGRQVMEVGDTFEDADWDYIPNWPKSSSNIDGDERQPTGISKNNRWFESAFRGQPDVIKRVPTPEGGIPGSKGALLLQSRNTGIPGTVTHKMQQDDLLLNCSAALGGYIPVSWSPSCVVRVYLPPFDQWEKRTGTSFALRADCAAYTTKPVGRFFARHMTHQLESYWPGIFIQFNSKSDGQRDKDSAVLLIRGDQLGHEIMGPEIMQPGWWTLGMSFTPDGMVHYYASPGVDKLTQADHITSQYPYGFRAEKFETFFFNVVNQDNGRNWSTGWIIDDPAFYVRR